MASLSPRRWPLRSVLCTLLVTAAVALPVGVDPDEPGLTWQVAAAKKGGEGRGGGGGRDHDRGDHDRGKDHGGRGHGKSAGADDDRANGRERGHGQGNLGDLFDDVRSGRAFGRRDDDPRVDRAKERYGATWGRRQERHGEPLGEGEGERGRGRVAHRFSAEETRVMIGRGWQGRAAEDGFANHGERVRTMVALAKRLGHSPRVGALQANFGTPFENGIAELQAELAQARAHAAADPEDPETHARVAELNEALAEAIATAKPGTGPDDGWATADLDVNDDGVVDRHDLAALDSPETGHAGTITPTRTYLSEAGEYCRDYREELIVGTDTGRFLHVACRDDTARWVWL